jgi:hypothetical protein
VKVKNVKTFQQKSVQNSFKSRSTPRQPVVWRQRVQVQQGWAINGGGNALN